MKWTDFRGVFAWFGSPVTSMAGETPVDIPEDMKKAKRTSLTYSSLLIVLCSADLDDSVKLFGVDAKVSSWFAIAALVVAAIFYALGFYIEHQKFLNRGASKNDDPSQRLDHALNEAIARVNGIVDVDERAVVEFRNLTDEFRRQLDAYWPEIASRFHSIMDDLHQAAQPVRPSIFDDGVDESPETRRDKSLVLKALSLLEWRPMKVDHGALARAAAAMQAHFETLPLASDRINSELFDVKEALGRFYKNVRSFDRNSIALYDVLPVYVLAIVGWFSAAIRLAIIYFN